VGDLNQLIYLRSHATSFQPPYLEVGSRRHAPAASVQDVRSVFREHGDYVGADLEPGPGVDRVVDFTASWTEVDAALEHRRFASVFCLSVLEHCEQPFRMAENITRLLLPGGAVCIGAPFAWKFHAYPCDYWRFTHEGVRKLFPDLAFDMQQAMLASERDHEFLPIDEDLGRIQLSFGAQRRHGHPLRAVAAGALRQVARMGGLRWLLGHRYLLMPANLLMIGVKPALGAGGPAPARPSS